MTAWLSRGAFWLVMLLLIPYLAFAQTRPIPFVWTHDANPVPAARFEVQINGGSPVNLGKPTPAANGQYTTTLQVTTAAIQYVLFAVPASGPRSAPSSAGTISASGPPPPPICDNDLVCESGETTTNCPGDCPAPPPPPGTSPSGTLMPPTAPLVDASGASWRYGPTVPGKGGESLVRNGVTQTGSVGALAGIYNGALHIATSFELAKPSSQQAWYKVVGVTGSQVQWQRTTDPRASAPPPPPPPPPPPIAAPSGLTCWVRDIARVPWQPVAGAVSYRVYQAGTAQVIRSVTTPFADIDRLPTPVSVEVTAIAADGRESARSPVMVVRAAGSCG